MEKKYLIAIFTGILILMVIGGLWIYKAAVPTRPEEEKYGRFDFFLYTVGADNTISPLVPSPDSREIIKTPPLVYFEALKNAYLYLLLFKQGNEMAVLFPGTGENFPRDYRFTRYFLPEGNNWQSYLKSPGEYTLCFVISTNRLQAVERLLSRYASSRKAGQAESTGREIIANLQAEIGKYKREQEWIKNGSISLEWTGGTVRSAEEEIIFRAWSIPFRGIILYNLFFNYAPGNKYE